jgi:hypothetical protein
MVYIVTIFKVLTCVMLHRGSEAILTKLKASGVEDPSEYISFHGLRTHSVLHGELVSSCHPSQH